MRATPFELIISNSIVFVVADTTMRIDPMNPAHVIVVSFLILLIFFAGRYHGRKWNDKNKDTPALIIMDVFILFLLVCIAAAAIELIRINL